MQNVRNKRYDAQTRWKWAKSHNSRNAKSIVAACYADYGMVRCYAIHFNVWRVCVAAIPQSDRRLGAFGDDGRSRHHHIEKQDVGEKISRLDATKHRIISWTDWTDSCTHTHTAYSHPLLSQTFRMFQVNSRPLTQRGLYSAEVLSTNFPRGLTCECAVFWFWLESVLGFAVMCVCVRVSGVSANRY